MRLPLLPGSQSAHVPRFPRPLSSLLTSHCSVSPPPPSRHHHHHQHHHSHCSPQPGTANLSPSSSSSGSSDYARAHTHAQPFLSSPSCPPLAATELGFFGLTINSIGQPSANLPQLLSSFSPSLPVLSPPPPSPKHDSYLPRDLRTPDLNPPS